MGAALSHCCKCCRQSDSGRGLYEPVLQENEREAVSDLLQYLEHRNEGISLLTSEPDALRALTTLAMSHNVDLQRSASLAYAEMTERQVEEVDAPVLEPLLHLLRSCLDVEVQRAASAALGNLAVNLGNKLKIVRLGGLAPLIQQMQASDNVEVQCNAVGCITNLATHEENKLAIARSGALKPLTQLAKTTLDLRVQRNATGALLNMTHSEENRRQLVDAGAVPVLVMLLKSADIDVVYYCTTALSNLAVDANNRQVLVKEEALVSELIYLMDSPSLKIQCQATLALRNLASDDYFQRTIAAHVDALPRLQAHLTATSHPHLLLAATACLRNLSIHPANEVRLVEQGLVAPLVYWIRHGTDEVRCHCVSTLRNLAAGSGTDPKETIMASGALDALKKVMNEDHGRVGWTVLSEMTACVAVLALNAPLKERLLASGWVETLLKLTRPEWPFEVQGNAAAALAREYGPFVKNWTAMVPYLDRFMDAPRTMAQTQQDETLGTMQHIALWTLVQLYPVLGAQIRVMRERIDKIQASSKDEEILSLAKRVLDQIKAKP